MSEIFNLVDKVLKRGNFKLKSGKQTTFYFNLRDLFSDPRSMNDLASLVHFAVKGKEYVLCPVPIGAIPLASFVSSRYMNRMVIARFERKDHGAMSYIDGDYNKEKDKFLVLEDVVTTGKSLLQISEVLNKLEMSYDILVVFDREDRKMSPFSYKALYTRSMYMRDKLVSLNRDKYLDTFGHTEETILKVTETHGQIMGALLINSDYPGDFFLHLMRISQNKGFLIICNRGYSQSFDLVREKFDMIIAYESENIEEYTSVILSTKVFKRHPRISGYLINGNIYVSDKVLKPISIKIENRKETTEIKLPAEENVSKIVSSSQTVKSTPTPNDLQVQGSLNEDCGSKDA